MSGVARLGLAIVAAAAAGLALGWFLWHGEGPAAVAPGDAARPVVAASVPAPSDATLHAVPASGERPAAPAAAEEREATPADPYPELDLRIVSPDGSPVLGGEVYALPAGGAGQSRTESVALASFEDGRGRLVLPRPGAYDVGATSGPADTLRTDVAVPSSTPVVLTMPALARVEVVVDDRTFAMLHPPRTVEAPGRAAQVVHDLLGVTFERDDPRPAVEHPGRDERAAHDGATVGVGPGQSSANAVELVAGRRYRVRAHGRLPVVPVPSEVVPPGRVRLVGSGFVVLLAARLVSPHATLEHDARVDLAFDAEGVRVAEAYPGDHAWSVARGQPFAGTQRTFRLVTPARRGRVTWSGEGVVPDGVDYEADANGSATVEAGIEVSVPPRAPPAPVRRSTRVRLVPPEDGTRVVSAEAWFLDGERTSAFSEEMNWDSEAQAGWAAATEPAAGVVAWGHVGDDDSPSLVAGPVVGPPDGAVLVLRRGGHVVLVPRRPIPPGLSLVVRRSDGGLLTSIGAGGADVEFVVVPGLVLGPLSPGRVALSFRLGGVALEDRTVDVRSGEHTVLVLDVGPRGGR